ASHGLTAYINAFGSYEKMYGSLVAVIFLMLYLYFLAAALLMGAVINAVFYHRTVRKKSRSRLYK
ncbi:MAG: YihY/virulence factor BrkB family protein, partial [Firmicutes bacterium]|nr:YihY/virulence factor BrkB family protein [Bacillota bacterium]